MIVSDEIKLRIIEQELSILANTIYQLSVRYKVYQQAGVKIDQISAVLTEMEQIQKIIDGYEAELKTLQS